MTFIFSTPSLVFMGDEARKGLREVFWCADKLLRNGLDYPALSAGVNVIHPDSGSLNAKS